ncbi:MAG TPA: type III-B CRISPR-associated protein Cas10/Cmr2, partial [Thermomicrobiales bacterium]|nr:type III-B CRISPR-associated protein Cas10/Cmr2 [Thermomicrobiales bacterium]
DPFIRRAASDRPEKLAALAAQAEAMAAADHPSVERFPTTAASGLEGYAAFPFDTQLFYDDGRSDADLRDRTGRDPQKQAERKQAAAFFQAAEALRRDLGIDELPKYFAVLVADGDHMGAAISAMTKRADHQRLSQRLAGFAAEADAIVRSHHGAMVYSGGDDVLAFLPLDRALTCADRLRQAFTKTMDGATGATAVSLSVGLAIGHYGEQLQRLLAWGRDAERAAKTPREPRRPRDTARNALAVSLHTRGAGEGRLVVHGWDEKPVTRRWDQWVAWHRADEIPDSAAFELSGLERELRSLWPDPDDDSPAANERRERYRDLLRREALRILGRRRSQHGGTPMEKTQRGAMADLIGDDPAALRRVADELLIARRLAAAADIAAEPRASPPVDEPAVAATGADGAGGRR